ncbi:MAG: helix-turn-helix domain-containing protein [Planctomycetia bacterium]|nr:helix-turn-helix domain-containing protein [Planctomycetia bacterium]
MSPTERLAQKRYTVQEVAELAGVRVETVYSWRRVGVKGHKLRFFMIGGRNAILENDLNNWMALTSGLRDEPSAPATIVRTDLQLERAAKLADGKLAAAGC